MAVLQISRIQHRRGLQQDLPQLASAELGWSIDQRRLFIGNGTLGEGAPIEGVTEILTQHTDLIDVIKFYIFKGHEGGFISQTGPTPSAPVVRSLQNKFDDFVSVRDFGAVGDGVTNDIDAIYRALQQIYKSDQGIGTVDNTRARRTIYFPAGTYNIGPSPEHPYGVVLIPPWCRIVGDGVDNTHIVQTDASMDYVLRFTDSSFVYDTNIGATPFIAMPTDVSIENMSLSHASNKDIVYIDNIVNLNFKSVQFIGSIINSPMPLIADAAIKFNAFKVAPDNITFDSCKFKNLKYAVVADSAVSDVRFNNCLFESMWSAFRLGQNNFSTPTNFRISNSIFRKIGSTVIDVYTGATGVVSTGNSYYDCGNNYAGPSSPSAHMILFRSAGNYSINDNFDRIHTYWKQVSYSASANIHFGTTFGIRLGRAILGMGDSIATMQGGGYIINLPMAGVVNYQVTDGTNYRTGKLTFTVNSYHDEFTSDTALDSFALDVTNSVLSYNAPVAGLTLSYNINRF